MPEEIGSQQKWLEKKQGTLLSYLKAWNFVKEYPGSRMNIICSYDKNILETDFPYCFRFVFVFKHSWILHLYFLKWIEKKINMDLKSVIEYNFDQKPKQYFSWNRRRKSQE